MGLAWQQGPLAPAAIGHFLVPDPLPERLLFAEPLRRRMRVRFGGEWIADSEDVVLLHEPGHYPVAYFPLGAVTEGVLEPTERTTRHRDLGPTSWYTVRAGTSSTPRAAWQHTEVPGYAGDLKARVAFAWRAMDAFYEEDEPILGHAADPYHRVDVRSSRRQLTVRLGGELVADTRAPLAVFETGFASRWYVPRWDVAAGVLHDDPLQTLCPYKGVARYFDVRAGGQRAAAAAWSYPEALPESARLAGYVSFDPGQLEVTLDGKRLLPAAHQQVVATGTDRNLAVV